LPDDTPFSKELLNYTLTSGGKSVMEDSVWRNPDKQFEMDEPRKIGLNTEFAFWLTTAYEELLEVVAALNCVTSVLEVEDGRSLVEISDEHDADEAWHWIRTELEDEVRFIELDPIWEEAFKWL
jgi:hypothetical protein